ncbi:MAG TPA: hypothetical protein VL547_13480 [Dinghuibacter sp.]|uniref:MutS family DNA mismatch repair protein n=1 Tax=Dinghuibacter sp. TaxID=2024697 RepID=UPI002C7CF2A2|nr:hypothetical protein [Dinghuibacter sp.]HTJ13040.1 hypothetical protein [Dinghuibacter sp.]
MKAKVHPRVGFYEDKLVAVRARLEAARRKRSALAWARFGTIILALLAGYFGWENQEAWWVVAVLGGLAAFGRAIALDVDNNGRIRRLEGLKGLVEQELYFVREDKPVKAAEDGLQGNDTTEHPYAFDLDIFGKGSLYRMVNRCHTEPGQRMLADWLLAPADRETILERQEAVKELGADPDGLFDLAALTQETPVRQATVDRILRWLRKPQSTFREGYWKVVRWVYPVVSLGVLAAYGVGLVPSAVFGLCCVVFVAFSASLSKRVIEPYIVLSGIVGEIGTLSEGVRMVEGRALKAALNRRLQDELKARGATGSAEIQGLDRLLHRFDYRLNPFIFIPLNAFLLWDLWQMLGLNEWRDRNKDAVERWINTLAAMEALGSVSLMHYNRPGWVFPEITGGRDFEATRLGHPLIPEGKRVANDFATRGAGQLDLVTGSNMAGKSTFLRTVGVNIVLAMAGAPVCADTCRLSVGLVASSMRVADNLEDSTSTFYAELKKLRSIIDRVKRKEPVFILLDEILRGTNSRDRLAGSQALVRQLIRDGAVGIVATHDLELAQMEAELPKKVHNYYFDVQFNGDELNFDYTLRKGVCTTRNAEVLMRQIGIEV